MLEKIKDILNNKKFVVKDNPTLSEIKDIILQYKDYFYKIESSCYENKCKNYIHVIDTMRGKISIEENDNLLILKTNGLERRQKYKVANGFSLKNDYHIIENNCIWIGKSPEIYSTTIGFQELCYEYRVSFSSYL